MKKVAVISIVSVLLVAFLAAMLTFVMSAFPRMNRPTALLTDVSFGMSQRELKEAFGAPSHVKTDPHQPRDIIYFYEKEIGKQRAELELSFKKFAFRKQLYRFTIRFENLTDTETFAQELIEKVKLEYKQEEGYYYKEEPTLLGESRFYTIGVNKGAVGVNFSVEVSSSNISVTAVCDEYDG